MFKLTQHLALQDLNCLIESYLEPLKGGIFLSDAVIERLFVNIKEIFKFHKIFLQSMEDAVHKEGPPEEYNTNCTQMKVCFLNFMRVVLQITQTRIQSRAKSHFSSRHGL